VTAFRGGEEKLLLSSLHPALQMQINLSTSACSLTGQLQKGAPSTQKKGWKCLVPNSYFIK